MAPISVGVSMASSSAADSGHISGDFTVTGGGGGLTSSLLPKLPTTQAWVAYLVLALVAVAAVFGVHLWLTHRK